jgi:hypothetical protein
LGRQGNPRIGVVAHSSSDYTVPDSGRVLHPQPTWIPCDRTLPMLPHRSRIGRCS